MRAAATIAALCATVAVVTAFSVTPNWATDIGGSADEGVGAVKLDASGNAYVVGWTKSSWLNATANYGGPAPSSRGWSLGYVKPTGETAGTTDAFLTKYNTAGLALWSVWLTGASNEALNAVTVSADGTKVLICGTYASADAKLRDTAGTATSLVAAANKDVIAAAFKTSDGTYVWSNRATSAQDDYCNLIVENSGSVVFGGSFGTDPASGTAGGSLAFDHADGTSAGTLNAINNGSPTGFLVRANLADGQNAFVLNPVRTHNAGAALLSGTARVATWDDQGNLWVASTQITKNSISCGWDQGAYDGRLDINIAEISGVSITSASSVFESGSGITYVPDYPTYNTWDWSNAVPPYSVLYAAVIGSAGQDTVTGIAVQNPHNNASTARVVLTGYTIPDSNADVLFFQSLSESSDIGTLQSSISDAVSNGEPQEVALITGAQTAWYAAVNGWFANVQTTGVAGTGLFARQLPLTGQVTGLACDFVSGGAGAPAASLQCVASATVSGTASFNTSAGAKTITTLGKDALMFRFDAYGNIGWVESAGGFLDDSGDAVALLSTASPYMVRPGLYSFMAGSFSNVSGNCLSSASPVAVSSQGGADVMLVSYDDVDDCGLDPHAVGAAPYGANACGLTLSGSDDPRTLGGSLCFDEPGYPLCFCHMNVTDSGAGHFCNARGWNCGFMSQYYYGLLDTCACPAAPNPHPSNPLLDVTTRLTGCVGMVCSFGTLTGVHANCLPLVLELVAVCGASPLTTDTDKTYIGAFASFYAQCNTGGGSTAGTNNGNGGSGSNTGADCTGYDFCAAPRASLPASTALVLLAASLSAVMMFH